MKRLIWLCALFLGISQVLADVKPGENVLINGKLEAPEIDPVTGFASKAPNFWTLQGKATNGYFKFRGGPDGKSSSFGMASPAGTKAPEISWRQSDMVLVPGEKYRFSAMVKTVGFKSPHCGFIIYDNGWNHSVGIQKFPENQDWTRMSADVTMIPSKNDVYGCALFACRYEGSIEFADVKIEALTPAAQKGTKISETAKLLFQPMLIPWKPLLYNIALPKPGQDAEMTFIFSGKLGDLEIEDCDIRYAVNSNPAQIVPLKAGQNLLKLKGLTKPGDFTLAVAIVSRKDGKVLYERKHGAAVIVIPEASDKNHKRLNNLVVEILNQPIAKTAAKQSFEFCTMRSGWVFIHAKNANAEKLSVVLDGQLTVIENNTPRLETFRDVAMGGHKLEISGAVNGGTIVVRSIPEIFNYCPGVNNGVPENPPFDWAFQEKYVLPAVTTENGGNVPAENRAAFFKAGYKWLGSVGTTYTKPDELVKKLETCDGMTKDYYQGVTCDEQFFNSLSSILNYTEGLKRFTPKNDHIVYTWITSQPSIFGAHNDFMAECLNASRSRGRLITEVYCGSKATKKLAEEYLDTVIVERVKAYKAFYPNLIDHWGIILGNFNQIPILSLSHYPNVDYKYYLDMQFNLLANHPECKDMGITGYWGSYYADYELHRWCFMLTRHYCVEGKKTMLSDEYGFTYAPDHLSNGDFALGFENWKTTGNMSGGKHTGFGSRGHNRWGGNGSAGDTFAVFTKQADEVSTVSQVAKNLVPGKTYCLQFSVVDYNDVKADKINPRQFGINVTLGEGAEIDKAQSWLHVDKRIKGRYAHNNGVARCNFHHIVFKATKPEIQVTFDNAKALQGEALGLNYVMLNPYLLDK